MAQERSLQSAVVQRCLAACRRIDAQSKIVSMTEDGLTGFTHLRLRAGDTHTLEHLRVALGGVMRFSTTRVTENCVDGTLEADVTVPTRQQEWLAARREVTRGRLAAYWLLLAWFCFLLGLHEWGACVRASGGKQEL